MNNELPIFSNYSFPYLQILNKLDNNINTDFNLFDYSCIHFKRNKIYIDSKLNCENLSHIVINEKVIENTNRNQLSKYDKKKLELILIKENNNARNTILEKLVKKLSKGIKTKSNQNFDYIWSAKSIDQLELSIKKNVKSISDELNYCNENDFFNNKIYQSECVLPIFVSNKCFFLYSNISRISLLEDWTSLASEINEWNELNQMNEDSTSWIIEHSEPIFVFDANNKNVFHNNAFSKLNLSSSDLLSIISQKNVELNNIYYELIESNFLANNEEYKCYRLNSNMKKNSNKPSIENEELGIITSSIAHELKNPIAGISAAIDVLEVTEELNDEFLELLEEMKKNVSSCKKLIEIFLGFSKTTISGLKKGTLNEALKESLSLLRCRLVELGYKTKFKFIGENNSFIVSTSSMTMFFYLLFSEVLTHLEHNKIFDNEQQKEISCIFRFESDLLEIEFLNLNNINNLFSSSNLIEFVINYEGLRYSQRDNLLTLKEWSLE